MLIVASGNEMRVELSKKERSQANKITYAVYQELATRCDLKIPKKLNASNEDRVRQQILRGLVQKSGYYVFGHYVAAGPRNFLMWAIGSYISSSSEESWRQSLDQAISNINSRHYDYAKRFESFQEEPETSYKSMLVENYNRMCAMRDEIIAEIGGPIPGIR